MSLEIVINSDKEVIVNGILQQSGHIKVQSYSIPKIPLDPTKCASDLAKIERYFQLWQVLQTCSQTRADHRLFDRRAQERNVIHGEQENLGTYSANNGRPK